MTLKRFISLILLILLLTACSTSRKASERTRTSGSTSGIEAQSRANYLKTGDFAWANVNKVHKYSRHTWQGSIQAQLDTLCNQQLFETTQMGICIYDLTDDCMLYAANANQRMRPASTMKLLTAITGLDILGKDYTYTPVVVHPGWGWCWDDDETGIRAFSQKGNQYNNDTLFKEKREWTMTEVLRPMLKKSKNLMAESMFWQLPTSRNTATATRKNCVNQIENTIRKTGLNPKDYTIADGSGLSLYNYVSPVLLTLMLRYAYQQKAVIYDNLYPALPIAGTDGTLASRMKGTSAQGNVHAKTGTVTGVSTLAGYCTTAKGHLLCFAIMNQGIAKAANGKQFQDKVCTILTNAQLSN